MRVGIQLPEVEREVRWPEYVAMARAAEEVGFDTLWLGDHLLYRYADGSARGPWEVWTTARGHRRERRSRISSGRWWPRPRSTRRRCSRRWRRPSTRSPAAG